MNLAGKRKILVTCPKGIPPFLAGELHALGFSVLSESVAGVVTEGSLDDTLLLNMSLRTGHRVLFLIDEFIARNPEELYSGIYRIGWEELIDGDEYLSVTSHVDNPSIRDSRFANVKCKDAIVDRMKNILGRRPDSGPERGGVVVHLYWKGSECSVYFDTSGEPLSRRGYRKIPLRAPLQETLAASIVIATGWDGTSNFINPMCGSGTLAIEAALRGLNRASGLLRSNFGFMHLRGFNPQLWSGIRNEAERLVKKDIQGRIIATDIRREAVEAARKNAASAGVEQMIEFEVCNFPDTMVPEGQGIVVLNPEYGERMGRVNELEETYRAIGDFFKQKCRGYKGFILAGNPELAKRIGLKPRRKVPFFNGEIECRLLEYELYEGSRKRKSQNTSNEEFK